MLASESAMAASKTIDQRWFEVEVILFSQLSDKSALRERFAESSTLPNYRTFDLLNDYLQPNLSELKAQLPNCEDGSYPESFIQQSSQLPSIYDSKTLEEIDQTAEVDELLEQGFSLDVSNSEESKADETSDFTAGTNVKQETLASDNLLPSDDTLIAEQVNLNEELIGLTDEQVNLINQAESAFSPIKLIYSDTQKSWFNFGKNNKQVTLCDNGTNQDDSFPVSSLSGRIDGAEFIYTDSPYLINSDSLQLKDIYLQLRRSKDFKPLLHMGWRQSLINRKPADQNLALKIYSGEHFQQQYDADLKSYKNSLESAALNEWLTNQKNDLINQQQANLLADNLLEQSEPSPQTLTPNDQKLAYIFNQIDQVTVDKEQVVSQVDDQEIYQHLVVKEDATSTLDLDLTPDLRPPLSPVQPWYIDGLFRLHLSHYLYITADFNISSLTGAELATAKLTEADNIDWKSIPFTQNRRVISGEVHYFDHPYMGMVVQIRRYEKPEPEDETLENTDN